MMSQPTVSSGASASAPAKPRALVSRPQLYVSGEVECGGVCATDMSQMYCSFRFRFIKSNWWLLNGEEAGDTFVADAHNGMCVWNHPFQAHFAALSLEGWPRLELTVRGQDGDGRNQLAGYGQILIPTRPGCHELIVQCWRPKSGQKPLRQKLLGEVPELIDEEHATSYIAQPNKSKPAFLAEDSVEVLVRFNVTLQEFKQNNLVV